MQGLLALQRYFDFSGRSARAEYWQFAAMAAGAIIVAYVLDLAIRGPMGTPTLTILVTLGAVIPAYAVTFRRLHDRERTGWWIGAQAISSFVGFILGRAASAAQYMTFGAILETLALVSSLLGTAISFFVLFQLVQRGTAGPNAYGRDPLEEPSTAPTFAEVVAKAQTAVGTVTARMPVQPERTVRPDQTGQLNQPIGSDPIQQIERLAELRDAGAITEGALSSEQPTEKAESLPAAATSYDQL